MFLECDVSSLSFRNRGALPVTASKTHSLGHEWVATMVIDQVILGSVILGLDSTLCYFRNCVETKKEIVYMTPPHLEYILYCMLWFRLMVSIYIN